MEVTDGNAGDTYYCNIGMRFFSKAATVLLLLVLGAAPVLGAVPCGNEVKSAMCCPPGCSMMGMGKIGAHAQIKSSNTGPSCCKVIPNTPVTMFSPTGQRVFHEVILVGATIPVHVPDMTTGVAEDRTSPNRQMHGRTLSILCTFRI